MKMNKKKIKGILISILALGLLSFLPLQADYKEALANSVTNIVNTEIFSEKMIFFQNLSPQPSRGEKVSGIPPTNLIPESIEFSPVVYGYVEQKIKIRGKIENSLFTTSLLTFAALNVADYFSTREALKCPGFRERNPLIKPFVKNPFAFAAVKLSLSAFSYYNIKSIYKKDKKLAWILSAVSNIIVSYAVLNNIQQIRKSER